jgi:glutaredoxin
MAGRRYQPFRYLSAEESKLMKGFLYMKRWLLLCCAVFIGLCLCMPSVAEMYKWVDDQGVQHFSDELPAQNVSDIETLPSYQRSYRNDDEYDTPTKPIDETIKSAASSDSNEAKSDDNGTSESYNSAEVELYSTSWCVYCNKARNFLQSKGVPFTEYDIEKDKEAAKRKVALGGGMGVPFAMINGKGIYGFSEAAYESALAQK